jgi:hypothetical protein
VIYIRFLVLAVLAAMPSCLAQQKEVGFRTSPLAVRSDSNQPLLIKMDDREIGVLWTNNLPPEKYLDRQNLMNGAGLALGDYDGDGRCDVYLCNRFGPNALYRNVGNWKFENVAETAGVTCLGQISNGAVFADINGDGKLDLLVTSFQGPNACFLNLGGGKFTNITTEAGLTSPGGSTSQTLADLDGDGDLDLYVTYFGMEALLRDGVAFSTRMVGGKPVVGGRYGRRLSILEGKIVELGEADILYRNDGGKFSPLPWPEFFSDSGGKAMTAPPMDFGLAVQIRDINGDGYPDIYVCNDFQTPDRIWINNGAGHFKPIASLALRNMSYASMGVDFADVDRDGYLDFITVEMLSRDPTRHLRQSSPKSANRRQIGEIDTREEVARNGLYHNRGDGTYEEIAWFSGVAASDWSWTPIFLDVDLDGYEDLLISNGHLHDVNDLDTTARVKNASTQERRRIVLQYPPLHTANSAFRNRGNLTFEDMSDRWGFNATQVTHGMALADLDNDGDLDVVANCPNGGPLFYKNNSANGRIAVRVRGAPPNVQGIGARVSLRTARFNQTQEMICGGRYLSSDDAIRVFALSDQETNAELEVVWRNGTKSQIKPVRANLLYEIDEVGALPEKKVESPENARTWFEDVSPRLAHTHTETPFNDFEAQPLLPRKYSQLGPGLAWFDLDQDAQEDLIVGAGRGGVLGRFQADPKGNFEARQLPAATLPDDSTAVLGFSFGSSNSVLVGVARYEAPGKNPAPVHQVSVNAGDQTISSISLGSSSVGPLVMADIDGDGDLDLFVGGRINPGHYPESAQSHLYRNENGAFIQDTNSIVALKSIRMASGAVFSDLDGDGFAELIVAEEWGPIRVFKNVHGSYVDQTTESGLGTLAGWWNSVTTGDLNGDGRLDIIAGNWGLNSAYQRAGNGPWEIYFGNLNKEQTGSPMLEAYHEPQHGAVLPWRGMTALSGQMPWLIGQFGSHAAFASADVPRILGSAFTQAQHLTARTLASMVFWNRGGGKLEAQDLPREAQWAPVFGINIADFDNDGFEDVFLAQNFFAVRPEDDRLDAGRGLLLKGKGDGALQPIPGESSGIKVYGEQRGSAVADFDRDGRLDLAVTQNGAATKLFHNVLAPKGLRVRLKGPDGNPKGYGSVLRVQVGERLGPAREVHCGSGYWSQDSAIQIFARSGNDAAIFVRWPGGKETKTAIPKEAEEIEIDLTGNCKVVR